MQRKDRPSEALSKPQVSENEYEHFLLTLTEWSYLYRIGHYEVRSPETDQRCFPPLWALRFSNRGEPEMRVTGDEKQVTTGRRKKRGEARLIRSLLPAFLHAQVFIEEETERERDAWVQGRVGVVLNCTMGLDCAYEIFDLVVSCATTQ